MNRDNVGRDADYFFSMSHELRTALNIMMAACTMAKRHIDDRNKALDYLERIYLTGERITNLIDDIMEIRIMEQGGGDLNGDVFSIDELEDELLMLLEPLAAGKGIELNVTSENFVNREVIGDYGRLLHVLINIATNSIKYTDRGGTVTICIEELSSGDPNTVSCRFTCSDSGIGMTEDFIKHIFEPFSRADDDRVREAGGTGLGMSIVKETVDLMGGSIHIDSAAGVGTTVTIDLKLENGMR